MHLCNNPPPATSFLIIRIERNTRGEQFYTHFIIRHDMCIELT